MGFKLKYSAFDFTCGGSFTKKSGLLTSPLYPNPYPNADCIYLISQPNGTYLNISFLSMDIFCEDLIPGSNYIEIRDGNSEDSPLMGKLCGNGDNDPGFMMSTQNHLRLK